MLCSHLGQGCSMLAASRSVGSTSQCPAGPPGCNSDCNFGALRPPERQPHLQACWAQLGANFSVIPMP